MRIDRDRWTRKTLAALTLVGASAVLVSPAMALAHAAGQGVSAAQAEQLATSGQLIQARAMLDHLARTDAVVQKESDRLQVLNLLKRVDGEIMKADPLEISLQKAELAAGESDLLMAERHAGAVAGKTFASAAQKQRAEAVLSSVQEQRQTLSLRASDILASASTDVEASKFAEAKQSIVKLLRSGVDLNDQQLLSLEQTRTKILDAEAAQGHAYETPISAVASMQPGAVRRPGKMGEPGSEPGRPEPLPDTVTSPVVPPSVNVSASDPLPTEVPPANQPSAPGTIDVSPVSIPSMPVMQSAPQVAAAPVMQDDLVTQAMRAEAYRLIAEGDQSFDSARYPQALNSYTLALAQFRQFINPVDAERVQRRIDECRVRMGGATGGGDIAQQTLKSEQLIRDRARAEFDNYLSDAEKELAAGSASRAETLLSQARLSVTQARNSFNESEFNAFDARLKDFAARLETKRDEIRTSEATKRENQAKATASKVENNRLAERERKVNENIDRIRALQQERKYDEALQVIDQTLFIDPNNPTALLLRDIIRDISLYAKASAAQIDKAYRHAILSQDNEEASVPILGRIEYPSDWPAKSAARGELAAFAETPENRAVLAKITSPATKIPLDLADNTFEDVIKFLQTVTQLNIDTDWESLAAVGVEKTTRVTLKLQPVMIQTALDRLLTKVSRDQFSRAGWAVKDGVLTIASEEALRKDRTLVIYNIQDLLFTIPNYRQVPQIDLNSVLQQGQGGSGTSPFQGDQQNQNQENPEERARRVRQITDIIQSNIDFEGWKDNGGETGALQELNGSLIITNTPKNHRAIVGLLSKIREIRNMQINVETKFLLVNQQWFEQIGFDLDVVFNAGSNRVTAAQSGPAASTNPNVQPRDFFDFAGQAGRSRGLQRTAIDLPVNAGSGNPASVNAGADRWSPIGTGQNSLGLTSSLSEGDFASGILRQAPALGIAGQFLDDIQVDFLITATQADKRSVRLTAPRLTFTNGQVANIYVVTQQAFVSGLNPIVGQSAVGFNPTVSVLSEGVTLLVEGVISSDRRYVTMNIDTGVARLDRLRQSSVSAVAGGQLVNSANTQSFIELPQITVTRIRTSATVPDEGTLLLGGQRLITEVEVETGVPILSKIPIINRFFTNRLETKEEQTLLILLKPTILIQSEMEEKAFPGLGDQLRSGLGIR